jgi:hypothetical protein
MKTETSPRPSKLAVYAAKVFDLLASVELAVFIILAIAVISAVGTVVEAKHGTSVASMVVYRSNIFTAVLILFVLNLAFAAFSRWPWKRHHIGFLVTHLGLILLLLGSVATRFYGVDGTVAFSKGESANSVRLDTSFLNVFVARAGANYENILSQKIEYNALEGFPGASSVALKSKQGPKPAMAEVKILDWWPKAFRSVEVKADPERKVGVPAVRFRLMGSRANLEEWLFLNGIQGSTIDLGPAVVRFQKGKPELKAPTEKRTLFIYFESPEDTQPMIAQAAAKSSELEFMGKVSLEKPVKLGWMDFEFLLEEFHQHATPFTNYQKTEANKNTVEVLRVGLGDELRWLEMGASAQVSMGEEIYYVQYTKQEVSLGFEISLNQFNVHFYPGSRQPMSYESRVKAPGLDDHLISMNEPLYLNGYTFYQSSYSTDDEGNPVISVLSVNRDPGRFTKYLGCLMLCLGILLMFYFKPVYSGKSKWFRSKQSPA